MKTARYTIVGHFDPATLWPDRPLKPLRPLTAEAIEVVLCEYQRSCATTSKCETDMLW
jgi:hypothetical protein